MKENPSNLVNAVLIEASRLYARLFRRNVGLAWVSTDFMKFDIAGRVTINVKPGDILLRQARPFKNGEKGQSDTYGWKSVVVTQDMVGQTIAQHAEVECKTGSGRESTEQKNWGDLVKKSGGIYGVARSVEDVARILG